MAATGSGEIAVALPQDSSPSQDIWQTLGGAVANLHVSEGGAGGDRTLFSLRGLSNTPYFSDSAVTVYASDIPLSGSFTYPTGLLDLVPQPSYPAPRVLVLDGPQMGTILLVVIDGGTQRRWRAIGGLWGLFDSSLTAIEAHTGDVGWHGCRILRGL